MYYLHKLHVLGGKGHLDGVRKILAPSFMVNWQHMQRCTLFNWNY